MSRYVRHIEPSEAGLEELETLTEDSQPGFGWLLLERWIAVVVFVARVGYSLRHPERPLDDDESDRRSRIAN